ncbi:J domain-containing protein [Chloroflexota bacterium]
MVEEAEVTKWISPKSKQIVANRARDRAKAAMWDLDIAVFLFSILIIVIILLFQDIGVEIVAPVAVFGLAMVWLVGWRRGRQQYGRFYDDELAKHPDDWKDYYKILCIGPNAEPKTVTEAYERLSHIYHEALSDDAKRIPLYSLMLREANEAYQVLSDPINRTTYDHIFWLKHNVEGAEIDESAKYELLDLSRSISHEVSRAKRGITWKIPVLGKVTRRVVSGVVIVLFSILFAGTSFAFAKPEHLLAAPFRGIAVTLIKTPAGIIGLIEDVRAIAATSERKIVSTALQSMRVDEGLERVPPVTVSTNDMARFPSREHRLFPDYLEKRFSQFKYTVDSKGIVSADTSWATTDAFLDNIKRLLNRLEKRH